MQVHRIPGHRIVPLAANAARHDLPAGNADMRLYVHARLFAGGAHRLVDFERRPGCPRRIVVMSDRRAENRHHAVADVLVDGAIEGQHDGIDSVEIALQQRVGLFCAQRGGKFREPQMSANSTVTCRISPRGTACGAGAVSAGSAGLPDNSAMACSRRLRSASRTTPMSFRSSFVSSGSSAPSMPFCLNASASPASSRFASHAAMSSSAVSPNFSIFRH